MVESEGKITGHIGDHSPAVRGGERGFECNRLLSSVGIVCEVLTIRCSTTWSGRMSHRLIAFVLLSCFLSVGAQNTPTRQNRALLVRMDETELTMHPTAGPNNVGNCLVVAPDGHAHLELRRQEFFNGRATLVSYEGTLTPKELDILRTILDGDAIRSLPQFVMPATPMGVDSFHATTAKISRPSGIQEIGYFEWQGKAPENAASARENWSRSATAMKPLVEWFHSLKSTFPWKRVSNPRTGVCGES